MNMKIYELKREQFLPIGVDEAWNFFSRAENLAKITPPELSFHILTELKDEPVFSGLKIDYTVKPIFGIPFRWTTEITGVDAPHVFTDRQLKGPYKLWEHTHRFEPAPGGVKMTDVVRYAMPLGILGELGHGIVVEKKLDDIFEFRRSTLIKLFGNYMQP
jgi:ligand-binding SRPBCC domain-containing protein